MKNIFGFGKGRSGGRGRTIGEFLALEFGLEPASGRGAQRHGGQRRGAAPSLTPLKAEAFSAALAEGLSSASGACIAGWTEFDGPAFLFLSRGASPEEEALAAKAAEALASLAAPHAALVARRLGPASAAAIVARLEAGSFFEAAEGRLLCYARPEAVKAAEEALAAPPKKGGEAEEAAFPASIAIERSAELVVSRLFMPPRFSAGAGEASVFWDRLSLGGAAELSGEAPRFWFGAEAELGERRHRLYFSLPAPAGLSAEAAEAYRARLGALVKAGWAAGAALLARFGARQAAEARPALRFGAIAAPSGPAMEGALFLEGELRLGSSGFGLVAVLPPAFQAFLRAALAPGAKPLGEASALASFMAANDELLAHWAASYRSPYLALRKPQDAEKAPRFPSLAALLELLGDRDAAIVLQNFLAPRFGGQGLPYLFYRHVLVERNGKRAYRPFPLEPFHEGRILRLLPAAVREDWEHEKLFDLPARTVRADDCLQANEAIVRELASAVGSGRLDLSLGAQALVERELKPKLEAEARAAVEALSSADIPFGFLAALPRREALHLIDSLSNKDLAVAALGEARHIELLHRSMSGGRRRDFDEELAVAEKRLERGELPPEKVALTKRELLAAMQERLAALRREEAASSTRDVATERAGGAPAGARAAEERGPRGASRGR